MLAPEELYKARIHEMQNEGLSLIRQTKVVSLFRLLTVTSICITSYLGFSFYAYYFFLSFTLVGVFIYFVRRHSRLNDKHSELNAILELNENELKCILGESNPFDYNSDIDCSKHIYANDLDIFGPLSLFRQINRTTTILGKRILTDNLLNPTKDKLLIERRKKTLAELDTAIDWRQRFFFLGSSSMEKPSEITMLKTWNAQKPFYSSRKLWVLIAGILTSAAAGFIIYTVFSGKVDLIRFITIFIILFTFNLFIYQFFRKHAKSYFDHFGEFSHLFSKWSALCSLISDKAFDSDMGIELREKIIGASQSLINISNLNKLIAIRLNGLMQFMNGLCLFDVWFILQIEAWRKINGDKLFHWIAAIGEMDSLSSLANYKFNHPTFCNAQLVDGHNQISAKNLGHPLIQPHKIVTNDFEIGLTYNAQIITGSNMSGKSTFLRAVGLNTVLALNGLPVCATSFSCSNLSVASCIRITDSLEGNESYFKAELNRLSQIMLLLRGGGPYLILLDEILRGTNSEDKRIGTLAFYRKMSSLNCLALLATHDPEIGRLSEESPEHFQNFHFESYVHDSDIQFDYRLRPGVSTTRNATLLMKKLDLID